MSDADEFTGPSGGEESPALRQKILTAAAALFGEVGYEKASMRHIASRIGYSATAIYLHFKNKEALMFAVVDEAFSALAADLDAAANKGETPEEKLRQVAWSYIDFGLAHPTHYRLMFVDKPAFLMARNTDGPGLRIQSLDVLQVVIERLLPASRGPRTLGQFADALWACVHGVVMLANQLPNWDRPRALKTADLAIELMAAGIELNAMTIKR